MTASGALAFDGRGWPWEWPFRWFGLLDPKIFTIVTKTLTRHPRPGNLRWSHPWSVVKKLGPDGWINSIGLTNHGIEYWLRNIHGHLPKDYKIIVSIEADDPKETVEMIDRLRLARILGIELNLSCPNTATADARTTEKITAICEQAHKTARMPLIAKLSCTHDYVAIAKKIATWSSFQAISINSVPWRFLYPDKTSPLSSYGGGGISGKIIQPISWKMVEELAKNTRIPVIAPSLWDYSDLQKVFDLGAKAASFGSVFISYPWRPTRFVKRWQKDHKLSQT